jgi:small conductance mechanosensitive channel
MMNKQWDAFLEVIPWEEVLRGGLRMGLTLLFAWIATKLIRHFLRRLESFLLKKSDQTDEPPTETQKRIETNLRLVKQALLITLWFSVALILLREGGVEIGPLLASAGIVGLAVGFGAQNLVRDFISGFFMIAENQIRVGDVAVINGTAGLVEKINLRTTVLRDLTGTVHIFPNGTISSLSNRTQSWSAYLFDIGVAYKENTDQVISLMKKVGTDLYQDEKFGPMMLEEPEIFGVDRFADSAVMIKGRIKTKPIRQWDVGREYLRRIKLAFDEHDIEIPFPHATIYFGQQPTADQKELRDLIARPKETDKS